MENINNITLYLTSIITTILRYIGWIILASIILYVIGRVIDYFSNYNPQKLDSKVRVRTDRNIIGGGQEAFLRIWVWQPRKKRICGNLLCQKYNKDAFYPRGLIKKDGRVRFPFRRECWVDL